MKNARIVICVNYKLNLIDSVLINSSYKFSNYHIHFQIFKLIFAKTYQFQISKDL